MNDNFYINDLINSLQREIVMERYYLLKEGLRLLGYNKDNISYNIINKDNSVSDNTFINNTSNPWAKGDSSFYLNSVEFLSELHPFQTSNS